MAQGRRRARLAEWGARGLFLRARLQKRAFGVGLRVGRWARRRRRQGERLEKVDAKARAKAART